jgi:hypothetical protein
MNVDMVAAAFRLRGPEYLSVTAKAMLPEPRRLKPCGYRPEINEQIPDTDLD